MRGRGRGFSRGGGSFDGADRGTNFRTRGGAQGQRGAPFGRGGRGFQEPAVNSKITFDDEAEAAADVAPTRDAKKKGHPVIATVLTSDGTELPAKVNTKIFVDGLPYHESESGVSIADALAEFVEKWKVGKVVHVTKKPGQGFGYVIFRSPNSVETAISVLHGKLFMGRALRVAVPKARDAAGEVPNGKKQDALGQKSYTRQVLVSDLPAHATPEVLKEVLLENAPELASKIEAVKMAGKGRKAFLTLAAEADVEPTIAYLNGFSLLGRIVAATKALPPGTLPYSTPALTGKLKANGNAPADQEAKPSKFDYYDHGPEEILVGNLPETVTTDQLKQHFGSCGRILDATLLSNPQTKAPLGIAKIKFSIPGHAKYAKEHLDGSRLGGNIVQVERGEERSAVATAADEPEGVEEVDEAGFARHMGVRNPKKYFADAAKDSDDDDSDADEAAQTRQLKKKKDAGNGKDVAKKAPRTAAKKKSVKKS